MTIQIWLGPTQPVVTATASHATTLQVAFVARSSECSSLVTRVAGRGTIAPASQASLAWTNEAMGL